MARLGEGDTVSFQTVTIGRNLGSEIEVLTGLAPGDTVILAPNVLLADGSRVRVRNDDKPGS